MKKFFKEAASALILCFALCSCSTTKSLENDAYYSENAKEISAFSLSNGIPVVFKRSGGGQIFVLRMIFDGGTPLVGENLSGIEGLTLDLCFHGSENYSYEEIQRMQYDFSFSMNTSSGRDYSVAGLKCLQKDLDNVLDLFSDSVLNPLFSESDFAQFIKIEEENLAARKAEPDGMLSIELENAVYKNSSYKSSPSVTENSIKNISLDDVKRHHEKMLDSKRIKFVVVANMDEEEQRILVSKLDGKFGNLKSGDFTPPEIKKIAVEDGMLEFKNENAGDSAYAAGIFDCPERYDSDYVPFAMALMILDDVLFSEVREKAGAVYSIGTGVLASKDMVAAVSAYKISDSERIFSLIEDALTHFPGKKEIKKNLDTYKNKYITTLFENSQSAAGVAANIITSLEYSSEPDSYLKRVGEVQNVTAEQIYRCYEKYIPHKTGGKMNGAITWILVKN